MSSQSVSLQDDFDPMDGDGSKCDETLPIIRNNGAQNYLSTLEAGPKEVVDVSFHDIKYRVGSLFKEKKLILQSIRLDHSYYHNTHERL